MAAKKLIDKLGRKEHKKYAETKIIICSREKKK
jgi:hypothetical protein